MVSTPSTRRKHEESLHFWTRGYMRTKTLNTVATFQGFSTARADTDSQPLYECAQRGDSEKALRMVLILNSLVGRTTNVITQNKVGIFIIMKRVRRFIKKMKKFNVCG
jgi:hypothetical protein